MMKRRQFIKTNATASIGLGLGYKPSLAQKTHIISFSFDDGFKKSFIKLAEIHEQFGLKACFNIIASGHLPEFQGVDQWILPELMGDFSLWNDLASRGHEVMPHSWKHLNLARQDPEEAKKLISKCITYFNENLKGFMPSRAIFNFPFNSSTPELDQYALTLVNAVRTSGNGAINPFPTKKTSRVLGCSSHGPDLSDAWVEEKVNNFLAGSGGWMILNLHGLDDEGWGPVSTDYFTSLLDRLVVIKHLDVLPTGMALEKYA
ncbi:MAG: polysaccharide deacetylase family protein [Cyclobacteriaceae bacterium]|nr:polysaccharide deacetylase family protein [Cyclobacteriaceae bacterium]